MDTWEIIKDIAVVLIPSIASIVTCFINKKTKKDIQLELEKNLKEKDADTLQIIQRINAELESQKQLLSWNNSMPQVNEYTNIVGVERYGNIGALQDLNSKVRKFIETKSPTLEELKEIKELLLKVKLPQNEEHLFPHEVPLLIEYNKLVRDIDDRIFALNSSS